MHFGVCTKQLFSFRYSSVRNERLPSSVYTRIWDRRVSEFLGNIGGFGLSHGLAAIYAALICGLILHQPFQSLFCAFIKWKHRVKHLCDAAGIDNERQPFYQKFLVALFVALLTLTFRLSSEAFWRKIFSPSRSCSARWA